MDADGREKRVLNNSETVAAREKQNKIVEGCITPIEPLMNKKIVLLNRKLQITSRIRRKRCDVRELFFCSNLKDICIFIINSIK